MTKQKRPSRASDSDSATTRGSAAQTATSGLNDHFEAAKASLSGQVSDVTEKIRNYVPRDGAINKIGSRVADGLDRANDFIEEVNLQQIGVTAMAIARRYPWAVAMGLVGVGVGMIITKRGEIKKSTAKLRPVAAQVAAKKAKAS